MRTLGRIVLWALAIVGLITATTVGVVWLIAAQIDWTPHGPRQVPEAMVLAVPLDEPFSEGEPMLSFGGFGPQPQSLRRVVNAIDAAAADDRVKALVARLSASGRGMGQTQELRDAIARFRASGKPALVFSDTLGEGGGATVDTYLASAFGQVWLQPSGGVSFTGFATEVPFVRQALEEIGVSAEVGRRWEYKNAIDNLVRDDMSPAHRASLERLLASWRAQVADGIAADRGLDAATVSALMDRPPLLAAEALEVGLVDRLGYWSDVLAELDTSAGTHELVPVGEYAEILPERPEPASGSSVRIALVHGVGTVVRGDGEPDPFGGERSMGSDTLGAALRDAMEDPDVRAIVLRIDSPGGSYVAADSIWHEVKRARDKGLPVIVSMGDVAASGGYFVAMPADAIVAQPGTITGSVGVFAAKPVLQDLWGMLDIRWESVKAGEHALMWSVNRPFGPAERESFDRMLDAIYADFTGKLAEGRKLTAAQVDAVARGRIWTGAEAKAVGLVDELGGLDRAVDLAKARTGAAADATVDLMPFPEPKSPLEALLDAFGDQDFPQAIRTFGDAMALVKPVFAEMQRARVAAQGPAVMTPERW